MKYDFDEIVTRRGTSSLKWDTAAPADMIPLWVADMDFKVYPGITEALKKRVEHGVFGYTHVPQSFYDSICRWFRLRHGVECFSHECFIVTQGVVPALSAVIRAVCLPGDKVLVATPVYNCFFSSIRNQGCQVEASPLIYADGTYTINWDDLEHRLSDPKVRAFILCNPHNPAGRVWTREEVERMCRLCIRHGVFIISDEIHNEIVMPGHTYTSVGALGTEVTRHAAILISPSKSFNTAGLQCAVIAATDGDIRYRIDRVINIHEVCDVNPFGVIATEAAYSEGGAEWLSQLNQYIYNNYLFLCDFLKKHTPQLKVVKLEGTYLVWVDCTALNTTGKEICNHLYRHHHVWLNSGESYGETRTPFVRINIACPRQTLQQGLERIASGINELTR